MTKKTTSRMLLAAATVFSVFVLLLYRGCPILALTGVPCPGCGMTRAIRAFFHLDFSQAFLYHPLFPVWIVLPFVLLFTVVRKLRKQQHKPLGLADLSDAVRSFFTARVFSVFLIIFLIVYLGVYVQRVLLPLFHLGDPTVLFLLRNN